MSVWKVVLPRGYLGFHDCGWKPQLAIIMGTVLSFPYYDDFVECAKGTFFSSFFSPKGPPPPINF